MNGPKHILSRLYDAGDLAQLATYQRESNESIRKHRDHRGLLLRYASTTYSISVAVREVTGVDIRTHLFPVSMPPFPEEHPYMKVLSCLDDFSYRFIHDADDAGDNKEDKAEGFARFRVTLVWKGFLLAQIAPAEEWQEDDLCALGSLRVFCSVSGVDVAEMVGSNDPHHRPVAADAWPPPAFMQLYENNRERIAPYA